MLGTYTNPASGAEARILEERIVVDRQSGCFTDGDAVRVGVVDDIVIDRDVLIVHFWTGVARVDQLIAHENGLRP